MKTKVFKSSDFKWNKVVSSYGTTYRTEINSSLGRITLVKVVALWAKRSPMRVGDLSIIKDGKRYTEMADYINESDAWTRYTFDEQLRAVIDQVKWDSPIQRCCSALEYLEKEPCYRWDNWMVVQFKDDDFEDVCKADAQWLEYLKDRIHNDIHRWWKAEDLEDRELGFLNNFLTKLGMKTVGEE